MNRLILRKLFVATLYGAAFCFISWLLVPNQDLVEVMTPITLASSSLGILLVYCGVRDQRKHSRDHNIKE